MAETKNRRFVTKNIKKIILDRMIEDMLKRIIC